MPALASRPVKSPRAISSNRRIRSSWKTAMTNMRGFETPEDEAGSNKNKIYAASIVAGAVGVFAVVSLATGMWSSPPAQKATFNVASNNVAPLPPVTPAAEMAAPTPVAQAPVEMAPAPPVRQVAPVRAARIQTRAPAALPPDETSPVVAPQASPDIVSSPAPTQPSSTVTEPLQPAPEPTPSAQPQP